MDPDATARELVTLARRVIAAVDVDQAPDTEDAARLAELTLSMFDWLGRRRGFEPDWRQALEP